jgi:tRNA nucleotidyltransferase/poly(A) polymerase
MTTAQRVADLVCRSLDHGEQAWLVGGAVRDAQMGRPSDDLDFVVHGDATRLARVVADRVGGGVFRYSERFSTHRVLHAAGHADFAPLRGDSLTADLTARDFTVNALAQAVDTGDVIDPLGGRADLQARRLRLCAPDALAADPVRILRLVRLQHVLEFEPEAKAVEAARAAAEGLTSMSGERLERELSALLGLPAPVSAVRDLDGLGALVHVVPELAALKGVSQNPYHHLDVFEHTLEALEHLPGVVAQLGGERHLADPQELGFEAAGALVPLAYAVLLHDLGKPSIKQVDEQGRILFWHHDEVGAAMAADVARRLKMSRRMEAFLAVLVRQHLRLGFLVREAPLTPRALARYRRDVEPYVFESVALSLADRMATRGPSTPAVAIARHFRLAREVWTEVAKQPLALPLDGEQVMALLQLEPGPQVGAALDVLREEVEAGDVTDAPEARASLLRWAREHPAGAASGGDGS